MFLVVFFFFSCVLRLCRRHEVSTVAHGTGRYPLCSPWLKNLTFCHIRECYHRHNYVLHQAFSLSHFIADGEQLLEAQRRCPVCLMVFARPTTMKRHMTLHFPHDAPKYHCDICQKSFSRKHYAKIHRLNVHGLLST